MEENPQRLEQNQHEEPMSFMSMVILTGFVGGILWSLIALLAYYFNLTDVRPNVILEPWALGDWKKGWIGTVFSIVAIGIFSIGAALLYYALLRKIKGLWVGMVYGVVLFFLVFYLLNPISQESNPFGNFREIRLLLLFAFIFSMGCLLVTLFRLKKMNEGTGRESEGNDWVTGSGSI